MRPMIRLDRVTKTFPGSAEPAVRELSLEVAEGEVACLVGPSGCGKTTTLRDDQPAHRAHVGDDHDRGPGHPLGSAPRASPWDRLRDPAGRAVRPSHGRGERRDRPEAAGLGKGAHRRPGNRSCSSWSGSTRRLAGAVSVGALGRAAAARRCRARPSGRSARAPDGRTLRSGRSDRPVPAAGRAAAPTAAAPQDDRVRHARHRRGDKARRPRRRPERRRHPRAERGSHRAPRPPRERVRRRIRRLGARNASACV